MKKTFEINGKTYNSRIIDFNAVCDFQDLDLDIGDIFSKPIKAIRAYVALCGNMSIADAGREIESHIKSGKDISEVNTIFHEAVSESGFFQALGKMEEAENTASQEEPVNEEKAEK